MKTVDYLERRTSSTLELINCSDGGMVSLFLQLPDNSKINLLRLDSEEELSTLNHFHLYQTSSKYYKSREKDIFNLIESGYKVVNEKMFNKLEVMRKAQLN